MIIVLDEDLCPIEKNCEICHCLGGLGTEITDTQIDEIGFAYRKLWKPMSLSKYIRDLIELARSK